MQTPGSDPFDEHIRNDLPLNNMMVQIVTAAREQRQRETRFFDIVTKRAANVTLSDEENTLLEQFIHYLSHGELTSRKMKWIIRYREYVTEDAFSPMKDLLRKAKSDPFTESDVLISLSMLYAEEGLIVEPDTLDDKLGELADGLGPLISMFMSHTPPTRSNP